MFPFNWLFNQPVYLCTPQPCCAAVYYPRPHDFKQRRHLLDMNIPVTLIAKKCIAAAILRNIGTHGILNSPRYKKIAINPLYNSGLTVC